MSHSFDTLHLYSLPLDESRPEQGSSLPMLQVAVRGSRGNKYEVQILSLLNCLLALCMMYAAESSADCDATFDAPQMGGFIGTLPRLCGPCGSQYRIIFGPQTAPLTSTKSLLEALFSSACAAWCRFFNLRLLGSYQLSTWVVCHNASLFGSWKKGTPNPRMISAPGADVLRRYCTNLAGPFHRFGTMQNNHIDNLLTACAHMVIPRTPPETHPILG